jgi:excisionase family DNA binding protein
MATIRSETTGRKAHKSARRHQDRQLVYTVPQVAALLGLSRNAAYDAAKRGEIPTLRMGRLLLVPKVSFHRMLGMTGAVTTTPPEWPDAAAKLPRAEVEEEDA